MNKKPKQPKEPETLNTNNKEIRIPRPKGLTVQALYASTLSTKNLTKKKESINNLYSKLISNYLTNNFTINNKAYSINQLANLFNIPVTIIHKHIHEQTNTLAKVLDKGNIEDTYRALISTVLNNSLQDRSLVSEHLQTLLVSQGGQYKAFVSSEVTKALKLMLESNTSTMDILGKIFGASKGNTNILITNSGPISSSDPNHNTTEQFTTNEALKLLASKGLTDVPQNRQKKEALYAQYDIENTPEVRATLLENNSTTDTLSSGPISVRDLPDNPIEDIQYIEHDERREHEYGISPKDDSI